MGKWKKNKVKAFGMALVLGISALIGEFSLPTRASAAGSTVYVADPIEASDRLKNDGKTFVSYVNNSGGSWLFGENWKPSDPVSRAVTLGSAYTITNRGGLNNIDTAKALNQANYGYVDEDKWVHPELLQKEKDAHAKIMAEMAVKKTAAAPGTVLNMETGVKTEDGVTKSISGLVITPANYKLASATQGYHSYKLSLPNGTLLPVKEWRCVGIADASHSESGKDFSAYSLANGAAGEYGLTSRTDDGQFAYYHGVLFHASSTNEPAFEHETGSACVFTYLPYFTVFETDQAMYREWAKNPAAYREWIYYESNYPYKVKNYGYWHAICPYCGEEIVDWNLYAPEEAIKKLPVLEIGREFVLTCTICGGLEASSSIKHECKAVSANRYEIKYDAGTADPDVTGSMSNSVFYTDNANLYERKSVTDKNGTLKGCKYIRPGYTFKGWAVNKFETNTTKIYKAGSSLFNGITLVFDKDLPASYKTLADGSTITLYAVWEPEESTLVVNAGNAFNNGAKYSGKTSVSYKKTYQINGGFTSTARTAESFVKNTQSVLASNVTLPSGWYGNFYDGSGNAISVTNAAGTTLPTNVYAEVYLSGFNEVGDQGIVLNTAYNGDSMTSLNYQYAPGTGTKTVTFEYGQYPIVLPKPKNVPTNSVFIGWYTSKPSGNTWKDSAYAGLDGDKYTLNGNTKFYARFSTLGLDVKDVYYQKTSAPNDINGTIDDFADATNPNLTAGSITKKQGGTENGSSVNYTKGAANISTGMLTSPGQNAFYEVSYRKEGESTWTTVGEDGSTIATGLLYQNTTPGDTAYTIPKNGFYKLEAYGAQGANYLSYTGGLGGYISGVYYLTKGTVLNLHTGGQSGGSVGGIANGGGLSSIGDSARVYLIAGGGGGAGQNGNGYGGGVTTDTKATTAYTAAENSASHLVGQTTGQTSTVGSGGGAGNRGGMAGVVQYHVHNSSCYEQIPDGYEAITAALYENYTVSFNYSSSHTNQYGYNTNTGHATQYLGWTDYIAGGGHTNASSGTRGYLTVGSIPVNGNNAVTIRAAFGTQNAQFEDSYVITVTGNDGTTLGSDSISYPYNASAPWSKAGGNWQGTPNTLVFNKAYSIPAGVTSITIAMAGGANGGGSDGDWWNLTLDSVYFSGKTRQGNLTCTKSTTTPEIATSAYGGSNYYDTSSAFSTGSQETYSARKSGAGLVAVSAVAYGTANSTNVKYMGVALNDDAAPDALQNTKYNPTSRSLTWEAGKSNGTSYEIKSEAKVLNAGIVENKTTGGTAVSAGPVKISLESRIAGYAYFYDKNATANIANTLASLKTRAGMNFAWSTSVAYAQTGVSGTGLSYMQHNNAQSMQSMTATAPTATTGTWDNATQTYYYYLHIAPIDVAKNVGPTYTVRVESAPKTVSGSPIGEIVFDTNKLAYQLSPTTTISYTYPTSIGGSTAYRSVVASGENKQGVFYKMYASVYGTHFSGNDGQLDNTSARYAYGGDFPVVTATNPTAIPTSSLLMPTFVGWNSKRDGSGTWYTRNGQGSKAGTTPENAKEFVFPTTEKGQTATLYAIWTDPVKVSITVKGDSVTVSGDTAHMLDNFSIKKGKMSSAKISTTMSGTSTSWLQSANAQISAQDVSAGVYKVNQTLKQASNSNILGVKTLYTAKSTAIGQTYLGSLDNPVVIDQKGTQEFLAAGTKDKEDDSLYSYYPMNISFDYKVQGTVAVSGNIYSRNSAASGASIALNRQGHSAMASHMPFTMKIDATAPIVETFSVVQDRLEKHPISELENAMKNGMNTVFDVNASDYNDETNGVYTNEGDSSGIAGVFVTVYDKNNPSNQKNYKMSLVTGYANTQNADSHILRGHYQLTVNLYAEFPNATDLIYVIHAVDYAGNFTDDSSLSTMTVFQKGTVIGWNKNGDFEMAEEGDCSFADGRIPAGMLVNYSIRTAIYSDMEDGNGNKPFNVGEDAYFTPGDYGHVEVWTVGYVESVGLNFGARFGQELLSGMTTPGDEAVREIKAGSLEMKYNLGTLESGYERRFGTAIAEVVTPNVLYLTTSAYTVGYTGPTTNTSLWGNALKIIKNGVQIPYAAHYDINDWGDNGTNVRIPPQYKLQPDGNKKKADGTQQYKWEIWTYDALGRKNDKDLAGVGQYYIWDQTDVSVHYRVTHES